MITNSDPTKNKTRSNKTLEILRALEENRLNENPRINPERLNFFRESPWTIRPQENLVFSEKEQKIKNQIQAIINELAQLAKVTQNLTKEVKQTVESPIINPGVYHLNFLEKIKETIILLRKKVELSAHWMAAANQRSKKQHGYWGQAKKLGTKFTLSQERSMATQTG